MFFVVLCCLAALCQGVLGDDYHINSASGLIKFSRNVNNDGIEFSGTTVFLDADLDFSDGLSEQFEPIGNNYEWSKYFQGTFNGQGHTISNLAMNSSSQEVGLFGYLEGGATIRNVVLDSSCSVVSSHNDSNAIKVGGIAGICNGCTIENIVNMASVAFTGSTGSNSLYLGGIAGWLEYSNKEVTVKNCASYGSVTHSGTAGYAYVGGIVGYSKGSSSKYIQNCLNYGTITHSGTTASSSLYIGGILGCASSTDIENCVSGGKITSNKVSDYIGSVAGQASSSTTTTAITHCYWISDVGNYNACGDESTTIDTETKQVSLNTTTMDSLNNYSSAWDKWFMLHLNRGNINNINQMSLVVTQKHFPDPVKEGNTFLFWCLDTDCNERYDPNATDITKVTGLYAHWTVSNYTVILNVNGGDALPVTEFTVTYDQPYNCLPNATRTEHTFIGWFTEKNEGIEVTNETTANITADNHTLYAHWTANNYTVTFDYGNGTVVNKTYEYNETIIYPIDMVKRGYTFDGWAPRPERMPAEDTTVVVHWTANNYTVTLNVNDGDAPPISDFIVTYDKPYNCLPNASRTGHTFIGWFTEKNGGIEVTNETTANIIADNHTLYAQWTINNYTITFDFGNGTVVNKTLKYNETIIYPIDMVKRGYTFDGWAPRPERMPAEDTTVVSQWAANSNSSNVGAIAGGIVGGIVLIIIIAVSFVLVVLFVKRDKTNRRKEGSIELENSDQRFMNRLANSSDVGSYNIQSKEVLIATHEDLYSESYYRIPTVAEALREAGLDTQKINTVLRGCNFNENEAEKNGKLFEGFTKEDAEAVALYTYDFGSGDYESNPYRLINKPLIDRNEDDLKKVRGLLFIIMSALRKLPRSTGRTLYRGLRETVNLSLYKEGRVVVWPALSSTSPDMKATKAFLAKGSNTGKAIGTLFIVEDGWGYDIQPYSLFPEEEEILLEPERQFKVQSVIDAEGITIITLKMLDTPLILPQFWGEGRK